MHKVSRIFLPMNQDSIANRYHIVLHLRMCRLLLDPIVQPTGHTHWANFIEYAYSIVASLLDRIFLQFHWSLPSAFLHGLVEHEILSKRRVANDLWGRFPCLRRLLCAVYVAPNHRVDLTWCSAANQNQHRCTTWRVSIECVSTMLAHSNNSNNFSSTFVLVHRSNQISFIGLVSSKDYY